MLVRWKAKEKGSYKHKSQKYNAQPRSSNSRQTVPIHYSTSPILPQWERHNVKVQAPPVIRPTGAKWALKSLRSVFCFILILPFCALPFLLQVQSCGCVPQAICHAQALSLLKRIAIHFCSHFDEFDVKASISRAGSLGFKSRSVNIIDFRLATSSRGCRAKCLAL